MPWRTNTKRKRTIKLTKYHLQSGICPLCKKPLPRPLENLWLELHDPEKWSLDHIIRYREGAPRGFSMWNTRLTHQICNQKRD